MQTEILNWSNGKWNKKDNSSPNLKKAQLVIYFGGRKVISDIDRFKEIKSFYPSAEIMGASTGGEIFGSEVNDDTIVLCAIEFAKTRIKTAQITITGDIDSVKAGKFIAKQLKDDNLKAIFVLSDGLVVNGSELVKSFNEAFPEEVIITGGLSGDGADFKTTLVGLNAPADKNQLIAVGFYGNDIEVSWGSFGGWDTFGPERVVTKSVGNILYELDGKPALDLYKMYLGEDANNLPGSALLFPLSIRPENNMDHNIVRTIVGIDEQAKSLIFAGDIPEGYIARLMRGDFDNLITGAANAANMAKSIQDKDCYLAILVSCIGRKLLLGQRILDETEAVANIFDTDKNMIGFYSYGEICPHGFTKECSLHNQTMTITLIAEK